MEKDENMVSVSIFVASCGLFQTPENVKMVRDNINTNVLEK